MSECRSDRYISDPNLIDALVRSLEEVIHDLQETVLPSLAAGGTASACPRAERGHGEPHPLDEPCQRDQDSRAG